MSHEKKSQQRNRRQKEVQSEHFRTEKYNNLNKKYFSG